MTPTELRNWLHTLYPGKSQNKQVENLSFDLREAGYSGAPSTIKMWLRDEDQPNASRPHFPLEHVLGEIQENQK